MTNPDTDNSIAALIARPSEQMSGGQVHELKKHLLSSCAMLDEVDCYEMAAALAKRDPYAAHAMILAQGDDPAFDPVFPTVRVTLMADIVRRQKAIEASGEVRDLYAEVTAESVAGGPADRAREAAFRQDPGRYLAGAQRSAVSLLRAPGFGIVRLDGVDLPWTYAAVGKARSDFSELYAVVEDGQYAGGILVGPAAAEGEVALPDGYFFVAVELGAVGGAA